LAESYRQNTCKVFAELLARAQVKMSEKAILRNRFGRAFIEGLCATATREPSCLDNCSHRVIGISYFFL